MGKYHISVATGALECLTSAGLIFGWPSVEYVLKKEGFMLNPCPVQIDYNVTKGADNSSANATSVIVGGLCLLCCLLWRIFVVGGLKLLKTAELPRAQSSKMWGDGAIFWQKYFLPFY